MNPNTQLLIEDLKRAEADRKERDRTTPSDRHPHLSVAEGAFLDHMSRWGSEGYPVRKLSKKWYVTEAFGIDGPPSPFKTKREAVAFVERYLDILRDRLAGRL